MTFEETLWGLIGLAAESMDAEHFITFLQVVGKKLFDLEVLINDTVETKGRPPTVDEMMECWFPTVVVGLGG